MYGSIRSPSIDLLTSQSLGLTETFCCLSFIHSCSWELLAVAAESVRNSTPSWAPRGRLPPQLHKPHPQPRRPPSKPTKTHVKNRIYVDSVYILGPVLFPSWASMEELLVSPCKCAVLLCCMGSSSSSSSSDSWQRGMMSFCKLNGRSSGIDVNKRERDIYRDTSVVHGLFHLCVSWLLACIVLHFSVNIFSRKVFLSSC